MTAVRPPDVGDIYPSSRTYHTLQYIYKRAKLSELLAYKALLIRIPVSTSP